MSDLNACAGCGALQAWTRMACQSCGARSFTPATLPAPGSVYSITTIRRAPDPAFAAHVPYSVALVRGAQGGLVMLPWDGPAPVIGAPTVIVRADTGLVARAGA